MADGFDLVVHSLHGAVGNSLLGPRQDSIEDAKESYMIRQEILEAITGLNDL